MKRKVNIPYEIKSVSVLHNLLGLKKAAHPLVSVIDLNDLEGRIIQEENVLYNFYCISLKKNFEGKLKYGQQYYDFDEGVMTFVAPRQILNIEGASPLHMEGFMLVVHPDFFRAYPLAAKIRTYGFFSYATNEALHLSDAEEQLVIEMMKSLDREISSSIDIFTQDLIVSHMELLLNYCNRFYNRQFITRKPANDEILVRLENLLEGYFNDDKLMASGMPTVQYVSQHLHFSPNYLSDMLRSITGQTTQQHIHNKLIERAKELLTTTSLSIGEIAYRLGFEYPQSFNKLFKNREKISPLKFRQSFN